MALSDYFKKVLIIAIGIIVITVITTTIMTFLGVSPWVFNPYMFFLIALGILAIFLSPTSQSVID
jgi:hypothetical protein